MTNRIEVSATQFRELCSALGYRKRKVIVVSTTSVILSNLNWQGGTRSTYHTMDIVSGKVLTQSQLSIPYPMNNEAEGAKIMIPEGIAIIETGVFQGEDMKMRIYVHPENMPKVIS